MKKLDLVNKDHDDKAMEFLAEYLNLTQLFEKEVDKESDSEIDWSELIKFSKTYPRFDKITLQKIKARKTYPHLLQRKSTREFNKTYALTIKDTSIILSNSAIDLSRSDFPKRLFPSGGSMYPTNVYLLNLKSSDFSKGLYFYNPKLHALELLLKDNNEDERKIICDENIKNPSALIIITSSYFKHCLKYGGRGFRYAMIEAGSLAQLIDIGCRDAKLDCVWLGGFNDDLVKKLLDINDELEIELPTLVIAIGKKSKSRIKS